MSNETKLGTKPNGNEGKDAVHIAIIPIRAAERVFSGMEVFINKDGEANRCLSNEMAVGIVDPFLNKKDDMVEKGSYFWLCLFPKTVTSLRHEWEHPLFPSNFSKNKNSDLDIAISEKWLQDYVSENCPQWEDKEDKGLSLFLDFVENERWIYYCGKDCHSFKEVIEPDLLFYHLSIVLGKKIDYSYFESFTCSC